MDNLSEWKSYFLAVLAEHPLVVNGFVSLSGSAKAECNYGVVSKYDSHNLMLEPEALKWDVIKMAKLLLGDTAANRIGENVFNNAKPKMPHSQVLDFGKNYDHVVEKIVEAVKSGKGGLLMLDRKFLYSVFMHKKLDEVQEWREKSRIEFIFDDDHHWSYMWCASPLLIGAFDSENCDYNPHYAVFIENNPPQPLFECNVDLSDVVNGIRVSIFYK